MKQTKQMTPEQMRAAEQEAVRGGEREAQGSVEAARNLRNLNKTSRPVQRKASGR